MSPSDTRRRGKIWRAIDFGASFCGDDFRSSACSKTKPLAVCEARASGWRWRARLRKHGVASSSARIHGALRCPFERGRVRWTFRCWIFGTWEHGRLRKNSHHRPRRDAGGATNRQRNHGVHSEKNCSFCSMALFITGLLYVCRCMCSIRDCDGQTPRYLSIDRIRFGLHILNRRRVGSNPTRHFKNHSL